MERGRGKRRRGDVEGQEKILVDCALSGRR